MNVTKEFPKNLNAISFKLENGKVFISLNGELAYAGYHNDNVIINLNSPDVENTKHAILIENGDVFEGDEESLMDCFGITIDELQEFCSDYQWKYSIRS